MILKPSADAGLIDGRDVVGVGGQVSGPEYAGDRPAARAASGWRTPRYAREAGAPPKLNRRASRPQRLQPASLATVAWCTAMVLAIDRYLPPAARRLRASACWWSVSVGLQRTPACRWTM